MYALVNQRKEILKVLQFTFKEKNIFWPLIFSETFPSFYFDCRCGYNTIFGHTIGLDAYIFWKVIFGVSLQKSRQIQTLISKNL